MALADIIGRIESDAGAEARALTDGAKAKAEAIMVEAKREAEKEHERVLHRARYDAEGRAAMLLANARLAVRDEMLARKRTLVERTLREAEERLVALDDVAYTRLIAQGVVHSACGGDVVSIAAADRERLRELPKAVESAVAEAGRVLELAFSEQPADIAHGVMLNAGRVSAEVGPASMVSGRHDELMTAAAVRLFPVGEA
ncbi:MAG: V-type ATP synthase subunit E family protein [Coriobacteriia bacterium]|nr:V-type ATP synthase subunit E family protein [Coriobacteriia bacterium]